MDAVGDSWSVFSLPGLCQAERIARAYKGITYFYALLGPRLFTTEAQSVTSPFNNDIGVVMDNICFMFTNLCAYIQLVVNPDGTWRENFVPKCISNDDIESYFSTWIVKYGYNALTDKIDQVAQNVDSIELYKSSPDRRHQCVVSNKKRYPPSDAAMKAFEKYLTQRISSYVDTQSSKYYRGWESRAKREIEGKRDTIRENHKFVAARVKVS